MKIHIKPRFLQIFAHTWLILSGLTLTSCSDDNTASVEFDIQGAEMAYVFRLDVDQPLPWDTLTIKDGKLQLDLPVDSTLNTFYEIQFDNSNRLRLGIVPGDKIRGKIDARGPFLSYSLTGSALSEQLCSQYQVALRTAQIIDSIDVYISTHPVRTSEESEAQGRRIDLKIQDRFAAHKAELVSIIEDDPQNLANVFAILHQGIVGKPIFSPLNEEDYLSMKGYAAQILQSHPRHPLAIYFGMYVERIIPQMRDEVLLNN